MNTHPSSRSDAVVPFTPTPKSQPQTNIVADDSGRAIVALLERAAEIAKNDCTHAMELAHKLSVQLRAAEERCGELEAQAAHFRDRAGRAEQWLLRIHNEVEQTLFQRKNSNPEAPQRRS
jgi:hypothetical protein